MTTEVFIVWANVNVEVDGLFIIVTKNTIFLGFLIMCWHWRNTSTRNNIPVEQNTAIFVDVCNDAVTGINPCLTIVLYALYVMIHD